VIRLHDAVVERITVRQEDVEIAVLVEIDEIDARRSPVRVRRLVDDLLLELEVALIHVRDDGLVFLRQERDEVHLSVLVQVGRDDVDRAGARIDHVLGEGRLRGFVVRFSMTETRPVLRQPNAATARSFQPFPPKSRLDVGHARPAVEPEAGVLAAAGAAQPDDRALGVILGKNVPRSDTSRSITPSLSTSESATCDGCGRLAIAVSGDPILSGGPLKTTPCRMSAPGRRASCRRRDPRGARARPPACPACRSSSCCGA
jgi:hypothetical protein